MLARQGIPKQLAECLANESERAQLEKFAASVHAVESLYCYRAIELWQCQSFPALKDFLDKVTTEPTKVPLIVRGTGMPEAERIKLNLARRIVDVFFRVDAPHWCCMDSKTSDSILSIVTQTSAPNVDFFNAALVRVNATLATDIFPHFQQALLEKSFEFIGSKSDVSPFPQTRPTPMMLKTSNLAKDSVFSATYGDDEASLLEEGEVFSFSGSGRIKTRSVRGATDAFLSSASPLTPTRTI